MIIVWEGFFSALILSVCEKGNLDEMQMKRVGKFFKWKLMSHCKNILLSIFGCLSFLLGGESAVFAKNKKEFTKPNIILIMTDDQGYGDLAFHNNPHIKTPVLDKLAEESVRLNNFYVSPVCAPTRSSLLTGRYSLRTGIRDTYNGGAIMAAEEETLAEILQDAGYSTAIFGKWHLGDNYPTRPIDQGFKESLVHLAGGIGQAGDYLNYDKGDSAYFDPVLMHNGQPKQTQGYCSDVFTDAAIEYIENQEEKPFFIYLAFNAPHIPLQLPQQYYDIYKDIDPADGFPEETRPVKMSDQDKEAARKVYGMVTNIDDNVGRIMETLEEQKLDKNTLVIFMTDNGPQQHRYLSGLRGKKGSVYQGGIKVPCFLHFPKEFVKGKALNFPTAHIDIVPTLAELCGATLPKDCKIDGQSLLPWCLNQETGTDPEERPLFFYWTRRSISKYHNMAVQKDGYKLVAHAEYDAPVSEFELFNLSEDPCEKKNLVEEMPNRANDLKKELDNWYTEMVSSAHLVNSPRVCIGTEYENPIVLNRNDAFGEEAISRQQEIFAWWDVKVEKAGNYNLTFKFFDPIEVKGQMKIQIGPVHYALKNDKTGIRELEMKNVFLPEIEGQFIPWYFYGHWGDYHSLLPFTVEIEFKNKLNR